MKTKNLAVGALLGVLTLALWYNFLLKPTQSEASKVKAEVELERDKLRPLQAQVVQARKDVGNRAALAARLARLQRAVPDSPELANFIRDANGAAVTSNLRWVSSTHGVPTPGVGGVASISLGIQVRGTYGATLAYLDAMSKLSRLVIIDGVQLSPAGTTAPGADAGGGSTGPFSGAAELTVAITGRMFETPAALEAATAAAGATGVTTAPVPPA